jgi:hypothetical protein
MDRQILFFGEFCLKSSPHCEALIFEFLLHQARLERTNTLLITATDRIAHTLHLKNGQFGNIFA